MNSNALIVAWAFLAWTSLGEQRASAAETSAAIMSPKSAVKWIATRGKIKVEGTSNLDDWQVESRSISGFMEVNPDFLSDSKAQTGSVLAEFWLEARSLKSVEKDGKPFSNKMDEIMYDALRTRDYPRISYRLTALRARPGQKRGDAPLEFDARGELAVGGVTNEVATPIHFIQMTDGQWKLTGTMTIKMTDFKIEPPAPKIALGLIRTGDELKLSLEWGLTRNR